MKTFSKTFLVIVVIVSMICFVGWKLSQAQETTMSAQYGAASLTGTNVDWNSMSDAQVELSAIEAVPPIPYAQLSERDMDGGTFWSAQHSPLSPEEWPPLPPGMMKLPVWSLGTNNEGYGVFLLDDTNVDYTALAQSNTANGVRAMDEGSDGGFSPDFSFPTNGFLLQINGVSNGLAYLTLYGTTNGVQYQILSQNALSNAPMSSWNAEGPLFWGSATTNWTTTTVAQNGRTNLFMAALSWADSTGTGIPDWWLLKYFGTTSMDPNALDSANDGWTIYQKFQMGLNPNLFYTPPVPPNLTVSFNASSSTANISWQPSLGPVTGYTVQKYDQWTRQTTNFNFSQSVNGFPDTITDGQGEKIVGGFLDLDYGPIIPIYYQIQAHYAGGDSAWSAPVLLEPNYAGTGYEIGDLPVALVAGPQGSAYLAAWGLPDNTATLRVKAVDEYAEIYYGNSNFDTIVDIPVSSSTNGLYLLPNSLIAPPADSYGQAQYRWFVQTIDASNNPSEPNYFPTPYASRVLPVYLDGRTQLKQNLIFLLRAANENGSFQFTEVDTNNNPTVFSYPANYAYAGLYLSIGGNGYFDSLLPFEENYRYRNFMLSLSPNQDVDGSGALTTGAGQNPNYLLALLDPPTYQFQPPAPGVTNIAPLLATNVTQWLLAEPYNNPGAVGISISGSPATYQLAANAQNIFGMQFQSTELAYATSGGLGTTTLSAGGGATPSASSVNIYSGTAQPAFQTKEYDFWQGNIYLNTLSSGGYTYSGYSGSLLPGMANFSTSQPSDLLIAPVGQSTRINGYAKLAVLNGYSGVYAYLGQYFDKAYQINTNGVVTTNTTGVLSSYGDFFPTVPGPAALLTMPDIDTGQRGTCTVYAISLNMDANHDGTMDTSFSGPDNTSPASPMEAWVNDELTIAGTGGNLDYDQEVFPNTPPNYSGGQINCQRDLENFFRLWVRGLPKLPSTSGYTITLGISALSGNPAINLYAQYDTNGSAAYLSDTNAAVAQFTQIYLNGQLMFDYSNKLATINSSQSYTLPVSIDGTPLYTNFLFEGAGIGEGQLTLTISQNGNPIAYASQWLDLHDIEDFYERAAISNVVSGLNLIGTIESSQPAIANLCGNDTNLIVFVHGIAVENWNWLDDSDTVFKRLYWAGYQGKFASVKWPCQSDPWLFDPSELNAYKASSALRTYLTQLRSRFPGYRLNILAHSQGNAITSEAIEQGAPFDTYILTQGAMPASCYATNAPIDSDLLYQENFYPTPNRQPMGYFGLYTNLNLTGRVVNFYNAVDFALMTGKTLGLPTNWKEDQILKPDPPYSSDGTNVWNDGAPVTDPEQARAFAARSRTDAVGATAGLNGVFSSTLDLQAQLGFGNELSEHSAQWTRPIQTSRPYYLQILNSISP